MKEKVVLAYSGGLDTTVIIPWLKENYDYEVIAVCVNVGQGKETEGLEEKAISTGASRFYLIDVIDEFIRDYAFPSLKAGAIYENKYLLGTAISRPLIAKILVDVSLKEEASAICHGATGKGNDQVRFELGIKALAPHLKIIAPWRIWKIKSREDSINYLKIKNINIPFKKEESYSRDRNLWHCSHEGLELENIEIEPDLSKILVMSVPEDKAKDEPDIIEIAFDKGIPVKIDNKKYEPIEMVTTLNKMGGENGIGIIDIIENRLVGMKSRGIYETPGGTILFYAHEKLEQLCLDKQTLSFKQSIVANKFAELLYNGEWFTPLREALSTFVDETQKTVTGKVKLKLYKGNIIPMSVSSTYSLYDEDIASFTTGDLYNHKDAEGFINLFGLPLKIKALMKEKSKNK